MPVHPWLSRRTVLRALGWLIVAPMPLALASMLQRHEAATRRPRDLVIPPGTGDAVTFQDEVIVCREAGTVRVFSARCTHLGCRIATVASDGTLVCPCHGSRFRLDGTVAAGPASRSLAPLAYHRDPRSGALIVHVS